MNQSRSITLLVCLLAGNAVQAQSVWKATGSLGTARVQHTETLLSNGKVLVAGGLIGCVPPCWSTSSVEIFDPATGSWTAVASMRLPRANHAAARLPNGKVLVAGGYIGRAVTNESELYDPDTGTWSATGRLNMPRQFPMANVLPDGKILITGGLIFGSRMVGLAELYDPATGTWSPAGTMITPRIWHAATLLPNGKVLVAAGVDAQESTLRSAELYDPASRTWTRTGDLITGRVDHTATLLPSGKVLVAGGRVSVNEIGLGEAELYDPDTGEWSATGGMTAHRTGHSATLLPSGKVLVAGGGGDAELVRATEVYDPASGSWTAAAELNAPRALHSATLLPDGRVLVVGGTINDASSLGSAELFGAGPLRDGVLVTVSAASFLDNGSVAPESFAAAFGLKLAATTQTASTVPLPISLDGVSVKVKDGAGAERPAALMFVSPGEINFQIPPGVAIGRTTVTVMRGPDTIATGEMSVSKVSPGLFSANGNGQGVAAAFVRRVRAGAAPNDEPVARHDATQDRFVAVPVDLGPETDQVVLVLHGNGIRHRGALTTVNATVGGAISEVLYAGPAPELVGVDQVNLRLPRSLVGRGEVDVALTVDGSAANLVRVNIR